MVGGLVGDILSGGELDPPVANIGLSDAGGGRAAAEMEVLAENGTAFHEVAVYVDGLHSHTVTADQIATEAGPLSEGSHDIDLVVRREEWFATPRFLVDRKGRRVLVRWQPVTASDCISYRIFHDDKTGTVDYGTIIATVDSIEVDPVVEALPDSGVGTGRLTVSGNYTGAATNALWRVRVTGSGLFDFDDGGGFTGNDIEFVPGVAKAIQDGISVCFLDAAGSYDHETGDGDTWEFRVGPQQWYASGELSSGTYKFGIKAVDAAGNVSSAGTEVSVQVTGEPDPVSGVTATYDAGDGEVTIDWTDAADTASVNIYSSWDSTFGDLADHILTLAPLASVAAGDQPWTYIYAIPADSGVVRFYIRAVDAAGIEEENFTIIEVDTATEPASDDVGSPFDLQGEPGVGGVAVLTWKLDTRDGAPASWNVYTFTSEPDAAAFAAATPTNVALSFDSYLGDIGVDSYTTGVLPGQRWFGVRAVDGSGAEDGNVEWVTVTPDSTAPSAVDPIGAGGI